MTGGGLPAVALRERSESSMHGVGATHEFKGCAKAECFLKSITLPALRLAPKRATAPLDHSVAATRRCERQSRWRKHYSMHKVNGPQLG